MTKRGKNVGNSNLLFRPDHIKNNKLGSDTMVNASYDT